jgi:YHS domain-containing protein
MSDTPGGHDHGHDHDHGHGHDHGHDHGPNLASQLADDEVAECPVMPGTMVVKADAEAAGLYRDYEGKRYWFCCAACEPLWDADPAKYANA